MILGTTRAVRAFAYPRPADLRKGYDGLFGLVKTGLSRDPLLCVVVRYVAVGPAAGRRDGFGYRDADGRAT
jgi:hypothetical protein